MTLKRFYISFTLALLAVVAPFASLAANPVVKASLDSVNLLMGKMTTLHLKVSQPKDAKGRFPMFDNIQNSGFVTLCGDSIELRAPARIDTTRSGNFVDLTFEVPLQAFDSGYYQLPEIPYIIGKDTILSNSLALKVYPVVVKDNEPIYDYANAADPEASSIFDYIPDVIYYYWWAFLLGFALLALAIYLFLRYRRDGYIIPPKPEPAPDVVAFAALRELKEKNLWQQGLEKDYYTELTEILRVYLFKRFGINAMEMTSRQILTSLSARDDLKDKRNYFRQILNMADFVKFAKVRPLPDDNVEAFDNAYKFVEETKPQPLPEEQENGNGVVIPQKAPAKKFQFKKKKGGKA